MGVKEKGEIQKKVESQRGRVEGSEKGYEKEEVRKNMRKGETRKDARKGEMRKDARKGEREYPLEKLGLILVSIFPEKNWQLQKCNGTN